MKKGLTDVTFLIDRSSSMESLKGAVKSGIKELIRTQKKEPGECNISVVQFDRFHTLGHNPTSEDPVLDWLCKATPMEEVSDEILEKYEPRGSTPLIQAMDATIDRIGVRLRDTMESARPEKVVVIVQTDGEENSSMNCTMEQLKERVETQTEKYDWQFVFLGANINAFDTGTGYGLRGNQTWQYTANNVGVKSAFAATSESLTSYRAGASASMDFDNIANSEDKPEAIPTVSQAYLTIN